MTLPVPKLDDRQFQDLVYEAKSRIPHYCKEWTDHNVSDPGVTLIELFAWMTEVLLYRLNQVPDLHYVRFMELLGIRLQEPAPASTPVTFWLSAPQPTPILVPAGTEVASTQTETEAPIVFSTDADLRVEPPQLSAVFSRLAASSQKTAYRDHNLRDLASGFFEVEVFSSPPRVDEALYFGFDNDLSWHILGFELDYDPAGGSGINPRLPPYIWEASTGKEAGRWQTCEVEQDATRGMNAAGRVRLHLPRMGKAAIREQERYWVRARLREITPADHALGMRPYEKSPRLRRVEAYSWGGTVEATHARQLQREFLDQSDGTPGQRFKLQHAPVLTRRPEERLAVQVENEPPQPWREVADFSASGSGDRHYTLDGLSGEIRFGPAVRQPDGAIKLYGAIPPRGANLVFERYRSGGGQSGNLQAGVLNTLKTAIPYIDRVSNREPAWGGLDAETLEAARMRAPALLRSRDRAVTEADFEFLARQALPATIGRVKCLQPRPSQPGRVAPGQVHVLVIPRLANPAGFLEPERFQLKDEDVAALTAYLDERRLLTTRLEIGTPAYQWVSVKARLRAVPGAERPAVEAEVLSRLYRFLNPLTGGLEGMGWEFGRDLFVSEIYQCLQGIPEVQFIRGVEMYLTRPGGEAQGEPLEFLEVVAHGVIASGRHIVEFV